MGRRVLRDRLLGMTVLVAAVIVFVLLLPVSGQDSDPPECFSVFGYVVPCGLGPDQPHGEGFAIVGAVVAAGLVLIGSAVVRRPPED
ncbi:MAG: hypothetical protein ACLGHX_01835 [Acidimicrobiia bacterium]